MASINTGKVVTGGLVAGVVANAVDFVTNNYVLAADWQAWAASHNIDAATLTSGAVAGTFSAVGGSWPPAKQAGGKVPERPVAVSKRGLIVHNIRR